MILDFENMFSLEQAVDASAPAEQIVDLGPGDVGPSESLSLYVHGAKPFSGSGSLEVALLSSNGLDASGALDSPQTLARYPLRAKTLALGGKLLASRIPHGAGRYLALEYLLEGSLQGGVLNAGLALDV